MKAIVKLVILLFCVTAFSQEQQHIEYKRINNNLIKVIYYFADNSSAVQSEGFFNNKNQLQGMWVNYNVEGNKTTIAYYDKGKKVGIWTYFKGDKINFVTYKDNKLIGVEEKTLVVN